MHRKSFVCLSILLLAIFTGCSPEIPADVDPPAFDIINVQVIPALAHWLPQLASCAEQIPYFGIYTRVLPENGYELDEVDLLIRLGEIKATDPNVAVMGVERLVVVAGEGVPLSSLSIRSVQAIFTGSIQNWHDLPEAIQQGNASNQPIQVLSYPEGHLLRLLFQNAFLDQQTVKGEIQIYNTVEFLESFLLENPYGIAYLLSSRVPGTLRILDITGLDESGGQVFVLAVTPQEPQGNLRQLLLCLQQFSPED